MTKSLAEELIEKTNVSSPKETKQNTFLPSNIFIRKENDRKIFSFQLTEIDEKLLKKNSSIDLSNSLQLENQRIEDENRSENGRKKNAIRKRKFAKFGEHFTILEEKICLIRIEITSGNAILKGIQ